MKRNFVTLAAVFTLGLPMAAAAQTAWDSPLLLPPQPSAGLGIFLTDMHRGGVGVMGTWRSAEWNYGLRGGISEGPGSSDLAVFGGVDYTGGLNVATADFPLDVDWVFGAGLALSDGVLVSFPLGLTLGHSFQGQGTRFTPFLTPRVVLDAAFGGERPGNDSRAGLDFAADLGLDLRFTAAGGPFTNSTIRFAASLGDRSGIGLGVIF